jgi:hypothetical protein
VTVSRGEPFFLRDIPAWKREKKNWMHQKYNFVFKKKKAIKVRDMWNEGMSSKSMT